LASELRSRAAPDRAEGALARFALLAAGHTHEFVVIGGLNPDFLAPTAPAPHIGTTDVDLLFEIGFIYDRDESADRSNRQGDQGAASRFLAKLPALPAHGA